LRFLCRPWALAIFQNLTPNYSGENFNPYVTIGIGTTAFLDAMLAEPFIAFTFSPASASVYQFGDYGTAGRQLKAFPAKS
jgi:hypothetical protein